MSVPDDHERFTRLFLQHEPEILRSVLVFVPHRADAREVVQETAVALWKRFAEYDASRSFTNWACGHARIEVRRFLRKSQQRRMLSERAVERLEATEQEMSVELSDQVDRLQDCLGRLPEKYRRLIQGYYVEDRTVNSLAQEQRQTVDSVYKALQRVRRALVDCLQRKLAHVSS